MRIRIMVPDSESGGLARSCAAVTQYLQTRGHECQVLSLNPPPDSGNPFGLLDEDYDYISYSGPWGIRSLPLLVKRLRSYDFDALWVCHPTFAGCLAAKVIHCRGRILSLHWPHFPHGLNWRAKLKWSTFYRLFGRDYSHIACETRFLRDELLALDRQLLSKAVVTGVPIAGVADGAPTLERSGRRQENATGLVVGSAGWLRPGKRFDVVLRVAHTVLSQNPNVQFRIAGDGPMREQLQSQAERLGISSRVRFLGWVDQMTGFYRCLDALLFCSDFETAGRAVGEAMASGVPVVCSVRRGGTRELVKHSETGFLFGVHDVSALSAALMSLLNDASLRQRIGEAARRHVAAHHAVQSVGAHYEQLLQSATRARPTR